MSQATVAEMPTGPPISAARARIPATPEPPASGFTRRTLLRRGGAAAQTIVVLSAGGIGYRAYDEGVFSTGDGAAYDAWRN